MKHLNYQQGIDLRSTDLLEAFQEEMFEVELVQRRQRTHLRREPLAIRPRRRREDRNSLR